MGPPLRAKIGGPFVFIQILIAALAACQWIHEKLVMGWWQWGQQRAPSSNHF